MHPGGQIFLAHISQKAHGSTVQAACWKMNYHRRDALWEIPTNRLVAHLDPCTWEAWTFYSASQIVTHLRNWSTGSCLVEWYSVQCLLTDISDIFLLLILINFQNVTLLLLALQHPSLEALEVIRLTFVLFANVFLSINYSIVQSSFNFVMVCGKRDG